MIIEWLKFRVSPEAREKFIQQDALIWTTNIAKYSGFLGKEVWINPNIPEEVVIVIRWESLEKWKSIPQTELAKIEQQFDQVMGEDEHKILESGEYQVRKFPQVSK